MSTTPRAPGVASATRSALVEELDLVVRRGREVEIAGEVGEVDEAGDAIERELEAGVRVEALDEAADADVGHLERLGGEVLAVAGARALEHAHDQARAVGETQVRGRFAEVERVARELAAV